MSIIGAFEWEATQGQPRVLTDRKRAISSHWKTCLPTGS
jgi:hypothetical protein